MNLPTSSPTEQTEALRDMVDALQQQIDRYRNLIQEIALVVAYEVPEKAVERVSELTDLV